MNSSHYLIWRKPETYANSAGLSFRLHLLRRDDATLSHPIMRGRPEKESLERDHPRIRESLIVYHQLSYHYLFCCSCTVSLDPRILQLPRNTISRNATKPNPIMSNQKFQPEVQFTSRLSRRLVLQYPSSSILHILLRRFRLASTWWSSSSPTLRRLSRRLLILQRHPALSIHLLSDIWTILERLREIADRADDIRIAMDGKRNDRHETEGKPWISLYDSTRVIAAVMTLTDDAFVAFEL